MALPQCTNKNTEKNPCHTPYICLQKPHWEFLLQQNIFISGNLLQTKTPFLSAWFKNVYLTLLWRSPYHIKTSTLICSANQWTGFYMIRTSFMKVNSLEYIYHWKLADNSTELSCLITSWDIKNKNQFNTN